MGSDKVADAIADALEGTEVLHICLLLADASTPSHETTEMSLVSDVDIHEVPDALRQFADQLEAKLAEAAS